MNSTLKYDLIEETGQGMASNGQPPSSTSTADDSDPACGGVRPFRWGSGAVRRLYEESEWALTSNPAGAAEVAGILLGKTGPTTEITDCRPVFLIHPSDHAYALTGPGKREFERVTAAIRSLPEEGLSVIGFYRSHIGDGFDLTEEDLGLVRTCLRDAGQLVLLVKLTAHGSTSVRLFVGGQCQISRDLQSSDDPSDVPRWLELLQSLSVEDHPLRAGPDDTTESVDPPQSVDPPESADTPEPADPAEPAAMLTPHPVPIRVSSGAQKDSVEFKRRSNPAPPFLLVAAIILTVLIAYPLFKGAAKLKQGTDSSAPAAVPGPTGSQESRLALRVESQGENIRLDWDRTAPVLGSATGGMLTIRERNRREKQVMVDGNLLRSGSVLYGPVHGDVLFRLVIFGQDGARLGESVTNYHSGGPAKQE